MPDHVLPAPLRLSARLPLGQGAKRRASRGGVRNAETVMATRNGSRPCAICGTDLLGGTAYLADGIRRGRGPGLARLLIRKACCERGCPDPRTGLTRTASVGRTGSAGWWAWPALSVSGTTSVGSASCFGGAGRTAGRIEASADESEGAMGDR